MFKKAVGVLFTKQEENKKDFVISNLNKDKYNPIEISLGEENLFDINGESVLIEELSERVDIIFNCIRNFNDGKLQKKLEENGISFVGSSSVSSSVSSNRELKKEILSKFEIKTPAFEIIEIEDNFDAKKESLSIFSKLPQPCVFKRDISKKIFNDMVCQNPKEIEDALLDIQSQGVKKVLVEEKIKGDEVTICGIEDFIEDTGEFYFSPFNTETGEGINPDIHEGILEVSRKVFKNIGLSGHFLINMVHSDRGVFVTTIDNYPDLSEGSIFIKLLSDYGIDKENFLSHLIDKELAR